jgi:hypothetical protein
MLLERYKARFAIHISIGRHRNPTLSVNIRIIFPFNQKKTALHHLTQKNSASIGLNVAGVLYYCGGLALNGSSDGLSGVEVGRIAGIPVAAARGQHAASGAPHRRQRSRL